MKHIFYRFSIIFLLSPVFISHAMKKEEPSTLPSLTYPFKLISKKITDYQEATKAKEKATQELWDGVLNNNLDKVTTALANNANVHATQSLGK